MLADPISSRHHATAGVPALATVSLALALVLGSAVLPPGSAIAASGDDPETTTIGLRSIATGLGVPVDLTQADDGTDRLFFVDQVGRIAVNSANGAVTTFLDLTDRIVGLDPAYDERGALGLAFHPDYAANGRFYVYYSAPLRQGAPEGWDHTSHISEFTVSADDANVADPDSERLILAVDQPYSNHNGGQIRFGDDGYLYIALGDGGSGGDTDDPGDDLGRPEIGNGQDVTTILGNILRIDVDGGDPYAVPEDNPFVGETGVDEIFAYGFRNPFGLSVDHDTGELYAADAGQLRFEEMSVVELGGNFGWNIKEATHCFDPDNFLEPPAECPDTGEQGEPLIDPIVEYERGPDSGSVIAPGIRYRGSAIPELSGHMVFADYATIRFIPTGIVYAAAPVEEGLWPVRQIEVAEDNFARFILGVAQDRSGEMYLLTSEEGGPTGSTGEVFAIEPVDADIALDWQTWWPLVAVPLAGILIGWLVWRQGRRPEDVTT